MVITVQDILLMDIGTKAYTEFDWDEDVVNYRMENIEALTGNWLVGHVHSHNTMDVFFSPTDMSELNDNCPNHNFYLSLIVNNFMEMTAKIAFTAKPHTAPVKYTCLNELGKEYSLSVISNDEDVRMFIYSCDAKLPAQEIKVDNTFSERLKEVNTKINQKAEAAKIVAVSQKTVTYPTPGKLNAIPGSPQKSIADKLSEWEMFVQDTEVIALEEQFLCYICRLGHIVPNDTIDAAMEDIEISQVNVKDLVLSVDKNFESYYNVFFRDAASFQTPEALLEVLMYMIDTLREHKHDYDLAPELIVVLKEYGTKLKSALVA